MLRRCLWDYWEGNKWGRKGKGYGGEGCVMIVDAAGAGYKNLVSGIQDYLPQITRVTLAAINPRREFEIWAELTEQEIELIPALAKVASRNFPGMLQAIFVVNAGWTQRSLWSMIKGVIPRSATERIKFIDKPSQLTEYFDPVKLPKCTKGHLLVCGPIVALIRQLLEAHLRTPSKMPIPCSSTIPRIASEPPIHHQRFFNYLPLSTLAFRLEFPASPRPLKFSIPPKIHPMPRDRYLGRTAT
jgi:hypothetical protein